MTTISDNIKAIKRWKQLANPSKKSFALQLITACITSVVYTIEPIFAANVIVALTNQDFNIACLWLVGGFALLLVRTLCWHINYSNYAKLIGGIYMNVQGKLTDKVLKARDANFKENSLEKIINIISSDVYVVSDFADFAATKLSRLFRVLLTFVIVFSTNAYIGLVILAVCIINYFVINFLNEKISQKQKERIEDRDRIFECFTDIVNGREVVQDLNIDNDMKSKYLTQCSSFINKTHKKTIWQSIQDNWFYSFWNLIVLAVTLYLVFTMSKNLLDLSIYLIIVPYLTSTIEKVNDFYNILGDIKNTNVSTLRINTILNFTDKEFMEFGKNSSQDITGELFFNNVSYTTSEFKSNNINIKSNIGQITLIEGIKGCGKRNLFHTLRRILKPDSGVVTFGNINIFDYDKSVYTHLVSYVTNKPYFFNGSIYDNFKVIEPNKKNVEDMCKKLNIDKFIMSLPEGYNTSINKNLELFSDENKFMIGLARALLTSSKIVMLYGFPATLTVAEIKTIKDILLKIKPARNILIFASNNICGDISDNIYEFVKGTVKTVKVTQPTPKPQENTEMHLSVNSSRDSQ
ncbi:MAG: ABC transporter ATP-binding protein [Clostridia bacterium]